VSHPPLRLPWTQENVPHAVLDILRGCNIRCRDCYNSSPDHLKSLDEIDAELDVLTRMRKLHSLSIVGGEITLHPDLVEIVRRVRKRGLFVELFTNGIELNDILLVQLKGAGANVIFLHIEREQRRPDLPAGSGESELRRLRSVKAAQIAAHGIEVGLAVTAYPEKPEEVEEAISFTLESPHVCYLLVTWWRDVNRMPLLKGDLSKGMTTCSVASYRVPSPREIRPLQLCQWLEKRFQLTPFASVGSNLDPTDARWLSFMIGTVHHREIFGRLLSLRATWLERAFLEAAHRLTGRYPFYQAQNPKLFGFHILLNALAAGGNVRSLKFLKQCCIPKTRLMAKRLLFQWPASLDEMGRVVHCECCPDAVLREGQLVPLCISDRIAPKQSVGKKGLSTVAQG
jgi:hypothetical protein